MILAASKSPTFRQALKKRGDLCHTPAVDLGNAAGWIGDDRLYCSSGNEKTTRGDGRLIIRTVVPSPLTIGSEAWSSQTIGLSIVQAHHRPANLEPLSSKSTYGRDPDPNGRVQISHCRQGA